MRDALSVPAEKLLFVQPDNGVLYLAVGKLVTEEGTGWFDQAVLFCPFCGMQLQTREEIKAKTSHQLS
jgi:hypothetical protein